MNAWHIEAADLRQFIIRHAHTLSGRNVDMAALVSLLVDTGGTKATGKKKRKR